MLFKAKATRRSIEVLGKYAERVGDLIADRITERSRKITYNDIPSSVNSAEQYWTVSFDATDFEYKKILQDLTVIRKIDARIVKIS